MSSERCAIAALAVAAAMSLAACSPDRDESSLFAPGDVGVPVVDALLVVDAPLPEIRLSRTQPPDVPYSFTDAALGGAAVIVTVAGADTVRYREWWPGVYLPDADRVVQPQTEYALAITIGEGERVTAVTTTPGRLRVAEWVLLDDAAQTELRTLRTFAEVGDGVYSAPENQLVYPRGILEGRLVAPEAPGYQLSVGSLDLDAPFVIDLPFLDDEDLAELQRSGSSPALAVEDDRVRLPWFSIYWEGRHVFRVLLLDRNAYDLVRTTPELAGGPGFGGNAGDGFERPLFRLEGAIGLFGSAAMDSIGFTVLPPE